MKTKTCGIMTGVILLAACRVQAVNKDFYSSGQILPGESWDIVNIYNDDTVVDMLGGSADWIGTHDASTLNVIDGFAQVAAFDYSSINISGGILPGAEASNYANADSGALGASQFGTANMYGGTVEQLGAIDSGVLNLYAGSITDSLGAWDSSVVNIYGYDFNYDPSGGAYDGGQLTGFWLNGTPFTLDLYGTESYSHMNLIPEPGTLALLGVGALLVRRGGPQSGFCG